MDLTRYHNRIRRLGLPEMWTVAHVAPGVMTCGALDHYNAPKREQLQAQYSEDAGFLYWVIMVLAKSSLFVNLDP